MIRKKLVGLVVIALFLLSMAGVASATELDLPKWVIVPEDSLNFADVVLFCGFDTMDTVSNVTLCYLQGTAVNATIHFNSTTNYPKLITGKILNAFEFSEYDNYVMIADSDALDFGTDDFAIAFWYAKTQDTADLNYAKLIVAKVNNYWDDTFWWVGTLPSDLDTIQFVTRFNSSEHKIVSVDNEWAVGEWHFVVINKKGTTAEIWIDGELRATGEVDADVGATLENLYIMGSDTGLRNTPGKIDELRIYRGRTLSQDEIKALYKIGRMKLSEPANFRQIFSPMIDLTRDKATFYAGLEVSTSDPNGYVPVPESAVNMSITSTEKLISNYTGYPFYYQGHYWYRADKIQFNLPIHFETLREKNSFAKEILLDDDSKTFIYEKEFRVTNPTATRINVVYSVNPASLGFSVLQYPQFELDGVPMAEWRPSNSTSLYLIRTDSLEPGEISTHWMKSIWTITKEELEFPAKLDDFRSITTFEQARKLAENAVEGKTDTYVKVIKIDSNADVNNVTVLVPIDNVEAPDDVIEAVTLTGSRETLQVEELEDGKIVVKVPSEVFVSGHAEIKVLYNKEGKSGIFAIISKILAKVKELLRKLGLGGLVFWPVYG